jgi:hypothetical protein
MSCNTCPHGLDCDFQQVLQNATVQKGNYRLTDTSLSVVGCVWPQACGGGATHGDGLCAPRHTGPLCNVCKQTEGGRRLVKNGLECVDCDAGKEASVYVLICGCTLLLVWALSRICSAAEANDGNGSDRHTQRTRTISAHVKFFCDEHFSAQHMEAFREKAQTKYKIMVTFA